MKINWLIRIQNKTFWLAFIPALLLLIQAVAAVFGAAVDLGELGDRLIGAVNAAFAVLSLLGIVADPTTEGVSDSRLAMTYDEPKAKGR